MERSSTDDSVSLVERPALDDLVAAWRQYMTACGCSPNTVTLNSGVILAMVKHSGVSHPGQLTRDHVIAWLGRPLKPWSRLTYWKVARAWSTWLREFDHDPTSDLTRGIPRPRTPAPVARPINDATIERLLALRLPARPHAYVRLALFEALRVHEIAKIQGEDFDLAAGWLLVDGKGGTTAAVPIHPEVAKVADGMSEIGFWFPSSTTGTGHVLPAAVGSTIAAALQRAGSNATAHQLRDTGATRMQRSSKDVRLTQAFLRHRNITSTMKYCAASNDELAAAVKAMQWRDPR